MMQEEDPQPQNNVTATKTLKNTQDDEQGPKNFVCEVQYLKKAQGTIDGFEDKGVTCAYKNETSYLMTFFDTHLGLYENGDLLYTDPLEENGVEDDSCVFKILYIKSMNFYLVSYFSHLSIKRIDKNPPIKFFSHLLSGITNSIQNVPCLPYHVFLVEETGKIVVANLKSRKIEYTYRADWNSPEKFGIGNLWIHARNEGKYKKKSIKGLILLASFSVCQIKFDCHACE